MSKQQYAKAKGRGWESATVDWLRQCWPGAERRRQTGSKDQGDIAGVPGWVIECKSEKRINLPGYLAELEAEVQHYRVRDPEAVGVVILKRRGATDAGDGYAVMSAHDWRTLARRVEALSALLSAHSGRHASATDF